MWPIGDIANLLHCSPSLSWRLSESPVTPGLPSSTTDTPIRAIQLINAMQISTEMRLILTSLPSTALWDSNLSFCNKLCKLTRSALTFEAWFNKSYSSNQLFAQWGLYTEIGHMKKNGKNRDHMYMQILPWTFCLSTNAIIMLGEILLLFHILPVYIHVSNHISCFHTNCTCFIIKDISIAVGDSTQQLVIMLKGKNLPKVLRGNWI